MSEYTVWMRIDLHSSQWPSEATWVKGTLKWALELASEQEKALKGYKIYEAKVWRDGTKGSVALEARAEAADFETGADLILDAIEAGLKAVNERNLQGIVYAYNGGAVEEEGYQGDFLRVLKSEFAIEREPAQPLTPQLVAYEAAKSQRQATLSEAMEAMYGAPTEEPGI
jgi:hypothetical protein